VNLLKGKVVKWRGKAGRVVQGKKEVDDERDDGEDGEENDIEKDGDGNYRDLSLIG